MEVIYQIPRTRLGDVFCAFQQAIAHLHKFDRVILLPPPQWFKFPSALKPAFLARVAFASRVFSNPRIQFKPIALSAPQLPRIPTTFAKSPLCLSSAKDLTLFDLTPSTAFNKPSLGQLQIFTFSHPQAFCISALAKRQGLLATIPYFQRAHAFYGCDSGFAHVAAAFDIPCFLYRFNAPAGRLEAWHKYHPYTLLATP